MGSEFSIDLIVVTSSVFTANILTSFVITERTVASTLLIVLETKCQSACALLPNCDLPFLHRWGELC